MTGPAPSSTEVARADLDGTSAQVRFVGAPGQEIFTCLNAPQSVPVGGVVICSPLHADFPKHYRTEVNLGRILARHGIASLRFHYRGTGHSSGKPAELTLVSMADDARTAINDLIDRCSLDRIALVGTRLGGCVAAEATASLPGSPLVLWEPVMAASTYLREAGRATLVGDLARHGSRHESHEEGSIEASDSVDVHGYPVSRALVDSFPGSLPELLGESARPILLLQVGRGWQLRPAYAECMQRWTLQGFDVTSEILRGEVSWWFRGGAAGRDDTEHVAAEGSETVVTWLLDQFRQSRRSKESAGEGA